MTAASPLALDEGERIVGYEERLADQPDVLSPGDVLAVGGALRVPGDLL